MSLLLLQTAARRTTLRSGRSHNPTTMRKPQASRQQTRTTQTSSSSNPRPDPTAAAGTSIPVPATVATLPLWQRLGPLTRTFEAYGRAQRSSPYKTQFFSSLVIYFLGDLSAQSISGQDYDPLRTGRALMIGAGSSIPSYQWFMFLGTHFNYPSQLLSLATKVVVNQLVFTPIFNSYFFGMQTVLSNLPDFSLQRTWEHIQRTVPVSFVNSCKLWPAVTAFSFTFVGPMYRSIFAGVIAIGWQTYLSYLNTKAENIEHALLEEDTHKTEQVKELKKPEAAKLASGKVQNIGQV